MFDSKRVRELEDTIQTLRAKLRSQDKIVEVQSDRETVRVKIGDLLRINACYQSNLATVYEKLQLIDLSHKNMAEYVGTLQKQSVAIEALCQEISAMGARMVSDKVSSDHAEEHAS